MNTKNKFQQIADNLELPLIFANPSLANLNLDRLALSDFNDDGLALIVSPIYASGLPVDDYGRIKRLFEISVVSLLPLDFDDEVAQKKLHFCEQKLLQLITMMRLDATTANHFAGKFDANLCGVFINAYWSDGGLCWYDKKIYFDQSEFKGLGLEKAPIAVRKISSDKITVGEISLTEKLANFTVEADETVTELSGNAVKSSGIWSWVTGLFVRKDDEDKGSVAVEGHEQEYNHDAFLTSVPPIPTDISELSDHTNIIPPALFFDDTYFSGAGTQVDPKSLRTENLPSGGGGVVKTASLTLSEPVTGISVSEWDDGTAVLLTRNAQLFVQMSDTGVVNESETSFYTRKVRFRPYKHPGIFTTNFVSLLDPIPKNGMELEVQANGDNTLVWKLNLTDWYVDGMGLRFNPEGDEYNVYTSIGDINIEWNGLSVTTMTTARYFKTGTKFIIKAIL